MSAEQSETSRSPSFNSFEDGKHLLEMSTVRKGGKTAEEQSGRNRHSNPQCLRPAGVTFLRRETWAPKED
jgi:hypothetical protein